MLFSIKYYEAAQSDDKGNPNTYDKQRSFYPINHVILTKDIEARKTEETKKII